MYILSLYLYDSENRFSWIDTLKIFVLGVWRLKSMLGLTFLVGVDKSYCYLNESLFSSLLVYENLIIGVLGNSKLYLG